MPRRSWPRPGRRVDGCAAIRVPGGAALIPEGHRRAHGRGEGGQGAAGCIWARRTASGWEGQGVKAVGQALLDALGGAEGDLLLAVGGAGRGDLARARTPSARALARRPEVRPRRRTRFAWVVDFPLFELDPETGDACAGPPPVHRAAPGRSAARSISTPAGVRALHYDAVLQRQRARAAARSASPIPRCSGASSSCSAFRRRRSGGGSAFCWTAWRAGAPPHGGFALGLRPDHDAAGRAPIAARRDRVSQDHGGAGPVRGCADAGGPERPRRRCTCEPADE